jgi:hypothetical protein
MRTSVDLPDDLMREAKMVAVKRGVTLRELMSRALRRELLATGDEPPARRRLEFPLVRSGPGGVLQVTEEDIRQAELEDDFRRSGLPL